MAKKIKTSLVLSNNYRELIFVFVAFALMVLVAYFSVGRILKHNLLTRAQDIINTAEANVRVGVSEAETALINSYNIVQGMAEQNASKEEVLEYLTATTEWMRQQSHGLLKYYGIYGYYNGEFLDGIGLNPDEDYIPQKRPWYQAAIRSNNAIVYTVPYTDLATGNTIVSAVRNINIKNGDVVGILALDINIDWLVEYIGSLTLTSGGYGMLLNQNMTVMAHPDKKAIGLQLHELGSAHGKIETLLLSGEKVFARQITSERGSFIIFSTRLSNGWYVGAIIPYFQFYKDLYIAGLILAILGLILSFALGYMLLRISEAKMNSDEENKAKSSFLAKMSHEIRTPMNAITGMAELLLRRDLPDDARSEIQDIKQAGNSLLSIINDILDFSKIEAGKLEIIPVNYVMPSMINDTVNLIRMRIMKKPLRLYTNIDDRIPSNLIGDEVRLKQILMNLLSNAVKYSEKGDINLSVVSDRKTDKQVWLRITVTDTGFGIKPDDLKRLFGDFVRIDTKKNRSIEGTGLGLAITKRLCHAMGGDITVKSEYGKGSEFTVIIPQGINPDAQPTVNLSKVKVSNFIFPKARLLIVDDIATNLKVAEGLLAPYKATVDTCLSGAQAIELVKQHEYDIVFMDHMMPEMDGIETTDAIRALEGKRFKTVPIIALTANAVSGMREMFIEKGFSDFLAKPIDIPKLDEILYCWIPKEKQQLQIESEKKQSPRKNMEDEKRLIILVDDNPANLRIGKNVLSEKYRVATAPSAEKMFSLLENNRPAMILLDIDMPDVTGYDAIKVLKSKPEIKNIPVIFLTGKTDSDDELAGLSLGAIDYITKPFQPPLLLKRIEVQLLVEDQRKTLEKQATELKNFNDNLQKMVDEKTENVLELQDALLKTMAEMVECRDDITGGHIERTQHGIKILIDEIERSGLFKDETKDWNVDLLLQSCQLHDVGKVSIADNILKKPGKLTDAEFKEMQNHTSFGAKIIEKIESLASQSDFLKYAKIFAASHHEKWNGKGYPNGLKENEIPLLGRIMAIADVYDALTSIRPYKKAFTHEESVRIINEGSGTHFDPTLVEVFNRVADRFR